MKSLVLPPAASGWPADYNFLRSSQGRGQKRLISMVACGFETHPRPPKATRSWLRRSLWLACAFLIISFGFSKEGMDQAARIEIIRGLLREVGVTKVPLPRGKRGVRID